MTHLGAELVRILDCLELVQNSALLVTLISSVVVFFPDMRVLGLV